MRAMSRLRWMLLMASCTDSPQPPITPSRFVLISRNGKIISKSNVVVGYATDAELIADDTIISRNGKIITINNTIIDR